MKTTATPIRRRPPGFSTFSHLRLRPSPPGAGPRRAPGVVPSPSTHAPEMARLKMFLKTQTDKALMVCSAPALPQRELWLPRSLVEDLRITPHAPGTMNYDAIEFTLPAWKVDQAALGEFVANE